MALPDSKALPDSSQIKRAVPDSQFGNPFTLDLILQHVQVMLFLPSESTDTQAVWSVFGMYVIPSHAGSPLQSPASPATDLTVFPGHIVHEYSEP